MPIRQIQHEMLNIPETFIEAREQMEHDHAATSRHRLKQKDLVHLLLSLFSEEYDTRESDLIEDITLPVDRIRDYIKKKTGVTYTSDAWMMTQIRKYEEEIGTRLFRKVTGPQGLALGLCKDICTYEQKRHLYITQKIRTANGVFDLIRNSLEASPQKKSVSVLLGAGSTVTRVAEIIANNLNALPVRWEICTHNLGVIESLGKTTSAFRNVSIWIPQGKFDPTTNLILSDCLDLYLNQRFDWIVQGTSFLTGGRLFVEKAEEAVIKSRILKECKGRKILVLTGHEATRDSSVPKLPFGSVSDYDYIIYPALSRDTAVAQKLARELDLSANKLAIVIRNWSYEILAPVRAK